MIQPLQNQVLIFQEKKEKTESGIYLPEGQKEKNQGVVVAVFPSSDLFVDQTVIFRKYGAEEVQYEGKDYLLVEEKNILAVIE